MAWWFTLQEATGGSSTQLEFWHTLVVWFAFLTVVTWIAFRRHSETTESLLVANRRVGPWLGIAAITATWTQAPAIYASGFYAAKSHWHFAMFWIPNVLAVILLLYPVISARRVIPKGVTQPQYMNEVFGPSVRTMAFMMQLVCLLGSSIGAMIGIGQWLKPILHIDPGYIGLGFGAVAVGWVFITGIEGGLIADRIKIFCFGVIVAGVGYLWWSSQGSYHSVPTVPPSNESIGSILWNTGVPLSVTLIGAALCFPDMAERGYALVANTRVQRVVYIGAALSFAFVTLVFGSLGVLATHTITEKFTDFPAFAVLRAFGSPNMLVIVSVLLSTILTAGLAAYVASAGSLLSIELYQRFYFRRHGVKPTDRKTVWTSRFFMLIIIPVVVALSNIPGISIPKLLEWIAAFRGEILFPALGAPILLYYKVPTRLYDRWIGGGMVAGMLFGFLFVFSKELFGADSFIAANAKPLGALCALLFPVLTFSIGHFFARTRARAQLQTAV